MDLIDVAAHVPAPGARWQDGDAFLAGGSWLFSEPQPDVHRLLDLHAFGWPALTVDDDGLELAATCTIAELAAWPAAPPLVRQCCGALLGSFKIWNVATVGGNICLALPAGPMTSLCSSLSGTCLVLGTDGTSRTVPVLDFVTGPRRTVLAPGELLRAVRLPAASLSARTALRRISLSTHGRSAALVIGRADPDGSVVLTVTAATPRPVQVRLADPADGVAAIEAAVAGRWYDDVHGDPRWRAAMTARFVAEVCAELSR